MNPAPPWSGPVLLGHAFLDTRRPGLFRCCARAVSLGALSGRSVFHEVLNELAALLDPYLTEEEGLWPDAKPAALVAHQAAHDAYRERIAELLYKAANGVLNASALSRLAADVQAHLAIQDPVDICYLRAGPIP